MLKGSPKRFVESPPISQSIEEMMGATSKIADITSIVAITNNEAISNSSSPIENEKI